MILEINEMIEYIGEAYQEFISTGRGQRYAIARLFDEYDVFDDDPGDIVEDMITMLAIGEKVVNSERIYVNNLDRLKKTYGKVELFVEVVKKQITEDELGKLLLRIKNVESALENVNVTYNPKCE